MLDGCRQADGHATGDVLDQRGVLKDEALAGLVGALGLVAPPDLDDLGVL